MILFPFNYPLLSLHCSVRVMHRIHVITSDVQPALYFSFTTLIDSFAGVNASIKGSGLADLQGQHPLLTEHAVLGIPREIHFVFEPEYLWLKNKEEDF